MANKVYHLFSYIYQDAQVKHIEVIFAFIKR